MTTTTSTSVAGATALGGFPAYGSANLQAPDDLLPPQGVSVVLQRMDVNDGSMASMMTVLRTARHSAISEAAEHLVALAQKKSHMVDRTYACAMGCAPFNPHEVQSGLRLFDQAAARSGGLMCGNVISNVQFSNYVRGRTQTECNGFSFAYDTLREADLAPFSIQGRTRYPGEEIPRQIMLSLDRRTDESAILYKLFHRMSTGGLDVHGWVLTDADHKLITKVSKLDGLWARYSAHSERIMQRALAAFTQEVLPGTRHELMRVERGVLTFVDPRVVAEAQRALPKVMEMVQTSYASDDSGEEDTADRASMAERPRG